MRQAGSAPARRLEPEPKLRPGPSSTPQGANNLGRSHRLSSRPVQQNGSASPTSRDGAPRAPRLVSGTAGRPLQVMSFSCQPLDEVAPQALGLTYWFDAAPRGNPYPVTIRFSGQRLQVQGKPGERDQFSVLGTVDPVLPGSGRIALTTRVADIAPGEWQVTAAPMTQPRARAGVGLRAPSRRLRALPSGSSTGRTAFAPVVRVRAPGVRIGAWPMLVSLGTVVAVAVQALLAAREQLPVSSLLLISATACLLGLAGAKGYYLLTHRGQKTVVVTAGMSIQGFVVVAIGTTIAGALLANIPVGQLLDVTVPGLLFGMTIGRIGCFLGGCCVGLPTSSRWGVWSSDRRLGVRRIPVQLFESTLAGLLGGTALLAILFTSSSVDGVIFVAALAAYTLGRQLLFPMRGIPRKTAYGRMLTMLVMALAVVGALAMAVFV